MEEQIIKEGEAHYFKSATHLVEGSLVLTNKRLIYSGTQARVQLNHGALGNIIRDKMETAMGYDNPEEQHIFDIPINEVNHSLKRFGLSKLFLITDGQNNQYKVAVKKSERDEWSNSIDKAKKG
jgi:hypothetical protein